MNNTYIRLIWLPSCINAVTVPDENADFNIFVNKDLCLNQQEKAINHELEHIKNRDFESFFNVCKIENEVKQKLG